MTSLGSAKGDLTEHYGLVRSGSILDRGSQRRTSTHFRFASKDGVIGRQLVDS